MAHIPTKNGFIADINVTPFVDVMLVLLIIFMVTAPLMTQGLEVELPETKTVRTLPKDKDHMVLTIKKDGSLFLDEYAVKPGELEGHLKRLVKADRKFLYLRADKDVTYGTVVAVMGEVKSAGIDKMGVVAEPIDERPKAKKK
ncbi:ExbD/TolR family protein [Desulfovibrio ferrophilus]|uniref:Protein TolR n=1 Tax=Desulfovibrio ferrophilus TaxID=241368 RepID=A0A2Z6AYJ8_9BACT|nr:ExbD/TolR family protein [Desulfovibrio ferrophilus]BBD08337.1 protein TolR [Desulfovibrio ferrophilus]